MKVLLLNGSPHEKGCAYTALSEVASALEESGVSAEILWLGASPASGCMSCGGCGKTGLCVHKDVVNDIIAKLDDCDGLVVGSPVHYASASGQVVGVMDRLFAAAGKKKLCFKPGAAVVTARRGGTTATLDQLNKYFTINQMPVVSSRYWNMVHGNTPDEVRQDLEGMAIMRTLGRNMAWLIKSIAAGKAAGLEEPAGEPPVRTNFIR